MLILSEPQFIFLEKEFFTNFCPYVRSLKSREMIFLAFDCFFKKKLGTVVENIKQLRLVFIYTFGQKIWALIFGSLKCGFPKFIFLVLIKSASLVLVFSKPMLLARLMIKNGFKIYRILYSIFLKSILLFGDYSCHLNTVF